MFLKEGQQGLAAGLGSWLDDLGPGESTLQQLADLDAKLRKTHWLPMLGPLNQTVFLILELLEETLAK